MTTLKKYSLEGKEVGAVKIEDGLIEATANSQMVKDYIVALRANARQWSASTQTRAEVNHSGKKPHAQKGTGLARQGYLGAPHYRGGGRVFAPRPKFDQHVRINKKERRAVMQHLLSEKIQENRVGVLQYQDFKQPKTKKIADLLQALKLKNHRVLFLSESHSKPEETKKKHARSTNKYENFLKSLRNIPKLEFQCVSNINGYDLMRTQDIIVFESAIDEFILALGGKS